MGKKRIIYDKAAIKKCRGYYVEFGGNGNEIEKAMRKEYPSWSKQNLKDRGKGKDERLGWIARYGFEKSAELDLKTRINAIENDDQRRYSAVVALADEFQEKALGGDEKAVNAFIKLTDQQIALRTKLDLSSSNFESFVEAYESIVIWAKEIDVDLAKLFYKRKAEFIKRAKAKYGKAAREN